MDNFKNENGHLYRLETDDWGRQTWIHVYQNARYSKDTKRNLKKLIEEYEQCD